MCHLASSLRVSSPGRSGGGTGKGRKESLQLNVKNTWKHAHAKGNDVITNVISANQHFASTFSMQIFKFQRRSCKISFLSRLTPRASRRACSQAIQQRVFVSCKGSISPVMGEKTTRKLILFLTCHPLGVKCKQDSERQHELCMSWTCWISWKLDARSTCPEW